MVPRTMHADHEIARAIGLGPAIRLSDAFGGETIELPLGSPGACTKRAKIERLLETTDLSHSQIARKTGATLRWVETLAARKVSEPTLL